MIPGVGNTGVGGDHKHIPGTLFDQHQLAEAPDTCARLVVAAENRRTFDPVRTQGHHAFESISGKGGHFVHIETEDAFTSPAEGEAVHAGRQIDELTDLRIFSFTETKVVGTFGVSDKIPVIFVVISKDVADLFIEVPVVKFRVGPFDFGIAGSTLFEVAVLDIVLQFCRLPASISAGRCDSSWHRHLSGGCAGQFPQIPAHKL